MLCAVVLGQQGWVASGRWGSGGGQVGHVAQGWVARGQAGQGSQVAWLPLTACTRCSPCSMSDLAVPFLVLFKDDALAFWCFAALMRKARRNFAHDDAGLFTQLRCAAPAAQTLPASHPERFRNTQHDACQQVAAVGRCCPDGPWRRCGCAHTAVHHMHSQLPHAAACCCCCCCCCCCRTVSSIIQAADFTLDHRLRALGVAEDAHYCYRMTVVLMRRDMALAQVCLHATALLDNWRARAACPPLGAGCSTHLLPTCPGVPVMQVMTLWEMMWADDRLRRRRHPSLQATAGAQHTPHSAPTGPGLASSLSGAGGNGEEQPCQHDQPPSPLLPRAGSPAMDEQVCVCWPATTHIRRHPPAGGLCNTESCRGGGGGVQGRKGNCGSCRKRPKCLLPWTRAAGWPPPAAVLCGGRGAAAAPAHPG